MGYLLFSRACPAIRIQKILKRKSPEEGDFFLINGRDFNLKYLTNA